MVKAMGGTVNEKERNGGMGNDVCYKIYSAFKKLFDLQIKAILNYVKA